MLSIHQMSGRDSIPSVARRCACRRGCERGNTRRRCSRVENKPLDQQVQMQRGDEICIMNEPWWERSGLDCNPNVALDGRNG